MTQISNVAHNQGSFRIQRFNCNTCYNNLHKVHTNRRKHMQRLCRLCLRIRTILFFPAHHIWRQMYIVVIFSTAADSAENPGQVRRHTTTTPICGLSDLADSHRGLPTSVTNCVTLRKLMSHVCASSKCLEHR